VKFPFKLGPRGVIVLVILLVAVLIFVGWTIVAYNGHVAKQTTVEAQWAQAENAIQLKIDKILNDYDPGDASGTPRLWVLDWWMVVLLVVLIGLAVVTRGRFLLFLPNLWKRGGFGGGRSGGGGAKRRF